MPITTAGLNQLPSNIHAHGTAISNTVKQVSGAIGTALLVTILTQQAQLHAVRISPNFLLRKRNRLKFFNKLRKDTSNLNICMLYRWLIKSSVFGMLIKS